MKKNLSSYVIVGHGAQGKKRASVDKKNLFAIVDPFYKGANYNYIKNVPLDKFTSAYVCVPDNKKVKIIEYLLKSKKNVMVEKPLVAKKSSISNLFNLAKKNKKILYIAYNHRFEPLIMKTRNILKNKLLGKIYSVNLFYGNGTSILVKKSKWKDKSSGVLNDLGSHLLDLSDYLFNLRYKKKFKIITKCKFENKSPDYVFFKYFNKNFIINYEMTYCMWKNSFYLDILGKEGSLHMDCLCKWGPSTLELRRRIKPSGQPKVTKIKIKIKDPTWRTEHFQFQRMLKNRNNFNDVKKNIWINDILKKLNK